MEPLRIDLGGGVNVELLGQTGGDFLGIGAASVDGLALRDGRRPIQIRVDTPEGILYTRLVLDRVERPTGNAGEARVHLKALGQDWGRGEYEDEYGNAMLSPAPEMGAVEDRIILTLKPAALDLGGRKWKGFSYNIQFTSSTRRIHRIWTHGSWEIGGSLSKGTPGSGGNTLLHQGQCNMPVYRGSTQKLFTTRCLKTLDRFGDPQGVSYQMAPRAGLIQPFDFFHTNDAALLLYWPDFGSIMSMVESPVGCDQMLVTDEYRFALTRETRTPDHHVLCTRGPMAEHEARDLWWHAHEHVYNGIRRPYGVVPTLTRPEASMRYSTRFDDAGFKMNIMGQFVDPAEAPYAIGDHVLPALAKLGIKRMFPEPFTDTDVTVLGKRRKLDEGIHGELHCASVCSTHRFFPSDFWGGIKAWRYMADKAKSLGIEMGAWFAPHFSRMSQVYADHPDWMMRACDTQPAGGGYGIHSIVTADWNTPIYDWVLNDIRRWKEEGGLDYIFTDSWANMGVLASNYAADIRENRDALSRLMGDFQKLGIRSLTFEGICAFGAPRFGLADLRGDKLEARGGIVGQNDFGWWVNEEDMAYGACLCVGTRFRSEEEQRMIQFRTMAGRGYVMLENLYGHDYAMPAWLVRLNHIYDQVLPQMQQRKLLADGAGVSWSSSDGKTQVVWATKPVQWKVEAGRKVERMEAEGGVAVVAGGSVMMEAWEVYRIK